MDQCGEEPGRPSSSAIKITRRIRGIMRVALDGNRPNSRNDAIKI
jgi:hypothetical protein